MKIPDLHIQEISKNDFLSMVYKYHYSNVMPRITKHYIGAYSGDQLIGGVSLGWGTQPRQTIVKLFPTLDTKDYYEIGKMCMLEEMPRNSESQMLSAIIKHIKKNIDIKFLFTWADGIVGKCGYVYQSANFLYGGFIWTSIYITKDGEKIHPRSTKEILKENAIFENCDKLFWMTPKFCKFKGIKRYMGKQFRYIYPITKESKELLNIGSTVKWGIDNYPKESDLIWKIHVDKGVYETTLNKPEFTKHVVSTNQRNYDQNFKTINTANINNSNFDKYFYKDNVC